MIKFRQAKRFAKKTGSYNVILQCQEGDSPWQDVLDVTYLVNGPSTPHQEWESAKDEAEYLKALEKEQEESFR